MLYHLTDPFIAFHLTFIRKSDSKNSWSSFADNANHRAYNLALREKIEVFRNETKTRKALHLTLITTYGVKPGKYASIVQSEVNMDELIE